MYIYKILKLCDFSLQNGIIMRVVGILYGMWGGWSSTETVNDVYLIFMI